MNICFADMVLRFAGVSPVVAITGGLGNQMFQYAFARSLGPKVRLDLSWFDRLHTGLVTPRNYELGQFAVTLRPISSMGRGLARLLPKIGEDELCRHDRMIARYSGYFQDELFFRDIRSVLLHEFSPSEPPSSDYDFWLRKIQSAHCSVSVHIRRGDYLKPNIGMASLGMEYYSSAMSTMRKLVEHPTFFVFTDDRAFALDYFRGCGDVKICETDTSRSSLDMMLMAACRHNIIANSSYSWWGAWLNVNERKNVVAPASWYKPWYKNGKPCVLPSEWIVI